MRRAVGFAFLGLVALPASISATALLERNTREILEDHPVMKVVRLLKDMEAELQSDLEDDKKVHEMLDCWCKTNEKEKTQAIETGEAQQSQLESFLGEAAAKMQEIKNKRDATLAEVDKDWAALNDAKAIRMKENQAYVKERDYLTGAVMAAEQAVVVLSKHHPELAQLRAVAHQLRQADVMSSKKLTSSQVAALKAFLAEPQGATSFLAIPGFQSYAPQSGQIFGILKQMKADFSVDLDEANAKEATAVKEFEALKAAKDEEIATGKKMVVQLDQEFAEMGEKKALAFKELEATKAQLELDRTFLKTLQEKCSVSDEEFAKRVKDRMTEIEAVADTIKIINSDKAFDNFMTTVNTAFLQMSGGESTQEQQMRQRRVASMLAEAAGRIHSPRLSLLATAAQLDAFTKVKEEIDKMVIELSKQQKDEIEHRDWCTKEKNENNRSTAEAYDKKTSLEAKMADLTKSIETLTAEIEASTKEVTEVQESMKSSSEIREGENAEYQQTVSDQRLTQMILNKALLRMKEVYLFLQQHETPKPGAPHIQTSATHTDPGNGPAAFKEYEENAGGKRVVSMLEQIIAESKTAENEAMTAEEDAQTAYETLMKESNEQIIAATKKIADMTEAKAKAEEDLGMAKEDFKQTVVHLGDLHDTLGSIVKSCKFIWDNFDARQAARAAEIDALKEAKAILSGMK